MRGCVVGLTRTFWSQYAKRSSRLLCNSTHRFPQQFKPISKMTLRISAVSVVFATLSKNLVESQGKVEEEKVDFEDGVDPVITVEELKKHNSESSLWVVYDGNVYDLTNFIKQHPGGREAILSAGSQDLGQLWALYPVHFQKASTLETLQRHRIGQLEDLSDSQRRIRIKEAGDTAIQKASSRASRKTWSLIAVGFTGPLWSIFRVFLRLIGFVPLFGERLVDTFCYYLLPVSLPGYGMSSPLELSNEKTKKRVAVVGGGISGVACAYTLQRAGYDVVVFEARDCLGGNAQVGTFTTRSGGREVKQDLSVLYWCREYYRNYCCFLEQLGIKPARVHVPYVLRTNRFGREQYYTPPGTELFEKIEDGEGVYSLHKKFKEDFNRFDRLIHFCRNVSAFFSDDSRSFYKNSGFFARFNPLNFISNRTLMRWYGISDEFYTTIFKNFHGFQFSTLELEDIPSVALPILDDIVPLTRSRTHESWSVGNSQEVFTKATESCDVRLSCRVLAVRLENRQHIVITEKERTPDQIAIQSKDDVVEERFDRVVFAVSNPHAVSNILRCGGQIGPYESILLDAVDTHDMMSRVDWKDWLISPYHQDVSCVAEKYREILLSDAAFLVDHDVNGGEMLEDGTRRENVEYHHILGSWSPSIRAAGAQGEPMFMSQCLHEYRDLDINLVNGVFSAPRAHPDLSFRNMAITQMMHLIQGRHGIYYCSNWTAPGNGHDLSFLSGVAVATEIGASYPFPHDKASERDWKMMRKFMGFD